MACVGTASRLPGAPPLKARWPQTRAAARETPGLLSLLILQQWSCLTRPHAAPCGQRDPPTKRWVEAGHPAFQVRSLCATRGMRKSQRGAIRHWPLPAGSPAKGQSPCHLCSRCHPWGGIKVTCPRLLSDLALQGTTGWTLTLSVRVQRPWRTKQRSWPAAVTLSLPLRSLLLAQPLQTLRRWTLSLGRSWLPSQPGYLRICPRSPL